MKVLILHNGKQDYVRVVLHQLLELNEAKNVVLISSNPYNKEFGIETADPAQYMERAERFKATYVHLSSNFYNFELFCIQRWFIMLDYLESINYNGPFLHMDSDVMCYQSLEKLEKLYAPYDVTICATMVPHMMYFKSINQLRALCAFIEKMYTTRILFLEKVYKEEFVVPQKDGGICDMRLIKWWLEKQNINYIDTTFNIIENTCSDSVFSEPDQYLYDKKKRQKITAKDEDGYSFILPEGKHIHCNCIHFQGKEKKRIIYRYYFSYNDSSERPFYLLLKMRVIDMITIPFRTVAQIGKKTGILRVIKLLLQKVRR